MSDKKYEITPERWEEILDMAERIFPDEKWPFPREEMPAFVEKLIKGFERFGE